MNYLILISCGFLAALLFGCGVKQEEVDRVDKVLVALRKDIQDLQGNAEEKPETDPDAITAEEVNANFNTVANALNSDIAGLQTSQSELEAQLQTLRNNLATAMAQLATKNTEIATLTEQVSELGAEKTAAENALAGQVRASAIRTARLERAADAFFDNLIVQQYREQNPDTNKTSQQLTLELGNHFTELGQFEQLLQTDPSFADKYQQAKTLSRLD